MKIAIDYMDYQEEKYQRIKNVTIWALIIVILTMTIIFVNSCNTLPTPAQANGYIDDEIANAIYKAENSVKYPYGIKSIPTYGNKEYSRKICLNTIRNQRKRHANHNCGKDFLTCLGDRYCPPKTHYLNSNWVRNVKWYLSKE